MKDIILEKLLRAPSHPQTYPILMSCFNHLMKYSSSANVKELSNWQAPILPRLFHLDGSELKTLQSDISHVALSMHECQRLVQKLIPTSDRKRLAVYYTTDDAAKFMGFVLQEYLAQTKRDQVLIADPFLGSGRTLTQAIQILGPEHIDGVWGTEPLQLPALIAYTSLVDVLKGRIRNLTVSVSDVFHQNLKDKKFVGDLKAPFADVILTNPPFTRWSNLEKKYRKKLRQLMMDIGYEKYLSRGGASLQAISLMLADYILKDNGLLATVLPASTFYTLYGEGVKQLLKDNYAVLALVEGYKETAFSEDSGFKEVILISIKKPAKKTLTLFTQLKQPIENLAKEIFSRQQPGPKASYFNIKTMSKFLDLNWMALFEDARLRNIVNQLISQGYSRGTLGDGLEVFGKKNIVRGLEMYGPDFFFLPNKFWNIVDENKDALVIQEVKGKNILRIEKDYLVKALRRWRFYQNTLKANVNHWMLTIPSDRFNNLPITLQKYINAGRLNSSAKSAINAFGESWYSHVQAQVESKHPFGSVFIPDKIDLRFKHRGVIANYAEPRITASKNFYIVKGLNERFSKVLIGWLNSIFFVAILVLSGRKISKFWTRFLENDYLERPVLNLQAVDAYLITQICNDIDSIIDQELPAFWNQLDHDYRKALDRSIASAIGADDPERLVSKFYGILRPMFRSLS